MIGLASMRLRGRSFFAALSMALAALSMSCGREANPESSTANDARVKKLEAKLNRKFMDCLRSLTPDEAYEREKKQKQRREARRKGKQHRSN